MVRRGDRPCLYALRKTHKEQTSMTKRFFYKDPLAAAWMTAKFGMEFIDLITGRIEPSDIGTALYTRGYVHPDSLHLLEPREGDLVKYGLSDFGVIGERCEYD